jgi:chromosome segregation protein
VSPELKASRLKSLELQGYKTFASKNSFAFAPTITAVVGPNGSGKSNIADALRWVLGEQSFSLLRGKRTEDMIFSGSKTRPRASMATATVTFDNSDGWLPIDFSEVTVSRRAYRDGQNEYLLNGQKVRLRDVNELLSKCGLSQRTYTIIGQGLVDAALSLRADERRRLFEEAAGIGMYRSRREEALRRLDTTRRNIERVTDILTELRPRLRSLDRQMKRSKDYEQVKTDLQETLRIWYGFHWYQLLDEVNAVALNASDETQLREGLQQKQIDAEKRLVVVRTRIDDLRSKIDRWGEENVVSYGERERVGRELAVAEERLHWVGEQQVVLRSEIEAAKTASEEIDRRIAEEDERADRSVGRMAEFESQREALLANGEIDSAVREQMENRVSEVRHRFERASADYTVWESRQAGRQERVQELRGLVEQAGGDLEDIQRASGDLAKSVLAAESNVNSIQDDLDSSRDREEERRQQHSELITLRVGHEKVMVDLEAQYASAGARLEVLQAIKEGDEIPSSQLLEAARTGEVSGLVGIVRDMLEIPAELTEAITAALGDFHGGLAFETSEGVDAVLNWVDRNEDTGRATLVPLQADTDLEILQPLADPDCIGNAAELIRSAKGREAVVKLLLGRTLVVKDGRAARRMLSKVPSDGRIVTLRGDVYLPAGQILVRRRSASAQKTITLESLRTTIVEITQQRSRAQEERVRLDQDADALQTQIDSDHEAIVDLKEGLAAAVEELEASRGDAAGMNTKGFEAEAYLNSLKAEMARLDDVIEQDESQGPLLKVARDEIELDLKDAVHTIEGTELSIEMTRLEAGLEVARVATEDSQRRLAVLEEQRIDTEADIAHRIERLENAGSKETSLNAEIEGKKEFLGEIEARLKEFSDKTRPAEEELTKALTDRSEIEGDLSRIRLDSQDIERRYAQAQIELARKQEEQASLRRRIEDDFGLVYFEDDEMTPGQEPLPFEGLVERMPRVESVPEELEGQMNRLRIQLRRMGPVNPEARREYREVSERSTFLTSQVDDLRQAEDQIREVIAELDLLMEREFRKTFEAVAVEFRDAFTRLFGGGSARLTLTNPDDLTQTGIDIEARLPGRRLQGLAMLSGGERSLTASALIFALLKVSPTPFCVLDEVDAMLDEANIARFRDMLAELSQETQFILITHNRLTVQAAAVVYGVSMGNDSASKVISLKLDEIQDEMAS